MPSPGFSAPNARFNYAYRSTAKETRLTDNVKTVVGDGAVVEYAIVGENTAIGNGAHIGAPPDGTDAWGVATCGPDIEIRPGAVVPASAMIYTGEEV